MTKLSTISKIFAVLSLMAASVWIGSYLTRLFLVYQLFEGPELILKGFINEGNVNGILFSIVPSLVVHFISFIVMIIFLILFYLTSKVSLRFNGWLFIICLLYTSPSPRDRTRSRMPSSA